jgi:hypothetical protein
MAALLGERSVAFPFRTETMIAFRVLLFSACAGLALCALAYLFTQDRRWLRRAGWLAVASAVLGLAFFGGLFLARLGL